MTQPRSKPATMRRRFRPRLEPLEARLAPASATVTLRVFEDMTGNGPSPDDALSPLWFGDYRETRFNYEERPLPDPPWPPGSFEIVEVSQSSSTGALANGGSKTVTGGCCLPHGELATRISLSMEIKVTDGAWVRTVPFQNNGRKEVGPPNRTADSIGAQVGLPEDENSLLFESWYYRRHSVSGLVFEDKNQDGIQNDAAAEPGIAGIRAFIDRQNDGDYDPGIDPSAITDSNGQYRFVDQGPAPDGVIVRFEVPEEYTPTAGPNAYVATSPLGLAFGKSGQEVPGGDLGLFKNVTVTGQVYRDNNGNGRRNAGEGPFANLEVFVDLNNDGRFDQADARVCRGGGNCNLTFTDQAGNFTLVHAGPGKVRVMRPVAGNFSITEGLAGYRVSSGVSLAYADFGLSEKTPTCQRPRQRSAPRVGEPQCVSGQVYIDYNGDGKPAGENEKPFVNALVYVDANNDGIFTLADVAACPEDATCNAFTDAKGKYTLTNVTAGVVRVQPPNTANKEHQVLQGKDGYAVAALNAADFGLFEKVLISGFVFDDQNGDGNWQKPEEEPLAGVNVEMEQNGNIVPATTDAQGRYEFKNVGPGPIRVSQIINDGSKQTAPKDPAGYKGKVNKSGKPVTLHFGRKYACQFRYANGVYEITGTGKADILNVGVATKGPYKGKLVVKASCGNDDPNAPTQRVQTKPLHALTKQITFKGGDGHDKFEDKTTDARFVKKLALFGEGGNDTLTGGLGDDTLSGGTAENDPVKGGANHLDGGPGTDRLFENYDGDLNLLSADLAGVPAGRAGLGVIVTEFTNLEEAHLVGGAANNTFTAEQFFGKVTLEGGAGDDKLIGSQDQGLAAKGWGQVLNGGIGDDSLYGGYGPDSLNGGEGLDGLFGGEGEDDLKGGAHPDRFLERAIWDALDKTDLNPVEDAAVQFDDSLGRTICLEPFTGASWLPAEIITVDEGLGELHLALKNVKFLRSSEGQTLVFERLGDFIPTPGGDTKQDTGGCNEEPIIAITNTNVNRDTVIHEIGHNWDRPIDADLAGLDPELIENFRRLSGWTLATRDLDLDGIPDPPFSGDPDFKQGTYDNKGDWWHYYPGADGKDCSKHPNANAPSALCPAEFWDNLNYYSRTNPREDFAEFFEAYFRKKRGDAGPWSSLSHKLNAIEAFVNGLKSP